MTLRESVNEVDSVMKSVAKTLHDKFPGRFTIRFNNVPDTSKSIRYTLEQIIWMEKQLQLYNTDN